MRLKIKLIILDFHGVLVKGDYKPVCRMIAKKHHIKWQEVYEELYRKHFAQCVSGQLPEKEVYLRTFKHFGWQGENWQKAHQYHIDAQHLNKTVLNYALSLQKRGYKILALSRNTPGQFKIFNQRFKFKKYLDAVVNTYDLGLPKASPETVEWIKKTFNVKLEEVVFCDDQEQIVAGMKKLGLTGIHYKNFKQFKSEVNKYL